VNRLNDFSAIEARLLELAHTTDAKITAAALAYFAPCSVDNAQRVLDDLTARGQLSMDVQDDGSIRYEMLGRQKLGHAVAQPVLRREVDRHQAIVVRDSNRSPMLAAFLSLWVPGAGQLYAGRIGAAFLWFLAVGMGYALILPGLVLHLLCIASAASSAGRGARRLAAVPSSRGLLAAGQSGTICGDGEGQESRVATAGARSFGHMPWHASC